MFKKAERNMTKIKIGISGQSGGGKTYSSLLIARGLVGKEGKIALVDTENRSSALYADLIDFDMVAINPPHSIEKYIFCIDKAIEGGYDCLILDSCSHAWLELLREKELLDQKGGNSFVNWSKMTPKNQAFIDRILQSDIHIISTFRSKQDYVMQTNDKGKSAPIKVGLAPVTRDGMDYEFSIFFDMGGGHSCTVSKDRTSLFDGKVFIPTIETGKQIKDYLNGGVPKKVVEKPKEEKAK